MCGRFAMSVSELEILQEFGIEGEIPDFQPRFNIAPGQKVLTIIHDGNTKRIGYLKWGLVPSWAKDTKIGYKIINARSESAHEKPSFKKLLASKRCLILADSFYEWKKQESSKQPKRIYLKNRKVFAFAGLWDKWQLDDQQLFTCTILTRKANNFMGKIHERMPVILPKEKQDDWITPIKREPSYMHDFIENLQIEELDAYNVSDIVNSAKNDCKECIEPLLN
ncbi:SOS response-associated peptidase [Aquibacillus rhizosphaerae]|uniref:Abasic site processing protein n=1 Tax=Aquibacillus rhizosphaerae TaxID=3051431 RepID=A0ABT7LBA1_9BACI|nr:SOS response-associated peptidase [Aquibacillus sp. LR5S19]MDL4841821.1 SOS response-associated peptidase [Aquibacillus sp. LR5S19]